MNKKISSKIKGMTPREIKAELILLGVTMTEIARQAGVTHGAVSQTINQYTKFKGYRIRPYIARAIGKNVNDIWPDHTA